MVQMKRFTIFLTVVLIAVSATPVYGLNKLSDDEMSDIQVNNLTSSVTSIIAKNKTIASLENESLFNKLYTPGRPPAVQQIVKTKRQLKTTRLRRQEKINNLRPNSKVIATLRDAFGAMFFTTDVANNGETANLYFSSTQSGFAFGVNFDSGEGVGVVKKYDEAGFTQQIQEQGGRAKEGYQY